MKFKLVIGAIIAAVLLVVLFKPIVAYTTHTTITATVTKTERANNGVDSKYLIFTDNEVFENTDSWLFLKFNSSDVYSKAVVGKTCEFDVYGIRFPLLSWYRNVTEVRCAV